MRRRSAASQHPPRVHPLRSPDQLRRMIQGWLGFFEGLTRLGDVVEWSIGPMRETLFFHPDHISEVLASAGASGPLGRPSGGFQEYAGIIGNNGLVMSEGPTWKRQRRLLQPGTHRQSIARYTTVMARCAEEMCDRWGDGDVLGIQGETQQLTRRIMTRTLFGPDLTDAAGDEIKRVMDRQLLLNSIEFIVGNWLSPRVPTPLRTALRRSSDRLRALFADIIEQRRTEGGNLKALRDADLLDILLDARDEDDQPLTEHQLGDEMHNLFLGGYETSANSLAFIVALLARHPDVQDRVAVEVQQAVGIDAPSFSHIKDLPLVEAVVKEALRLYPPVFALPIHVVKTQTMLCGFSFQPGQRVNVCPWVTQRDRRWFAHPMEFRPDRWLDGSTDNIPRFAWIPFGGGPRVCYGQHFAMAEMVVTVAVMARRFAFSLPPGASRDIEAGLTGSAMLRLKNDAVALASRTVGSGSLTTIDQRGRHLQRHA
ncbi:cytochrome P450 [Mycobacterium decipiens]|uniref:Cytochrome P450 n=1 Tax=Mycobacterium decipiens TaxID=1430326 RepID=A0A1X2LXN7_9MYCO|nr:cytochrome P450 [Mycobacterium decipiens]OSC41964.1 hypothetical protein B8W66_05330 [Mycobacterium decipiens]